MRIGRTRAWDRAVDLADGAKYDLAIATGTAIFAGLAAIDANYAFFQGGRFLATIISYASAAGAAIFGTRAGVRAVGAGAFAVMAGAQYVLGAGSRASSETAAAARADKAD